MPPLVLSIADTRPEAIKLAPVLAEIAQRGVLRQHLVLTGQHRDLHSYFRGLDVESSCLSSNISNLTAGEMSDLFAEQLSGFLLRLRPDLVLVQGETASALGGALAASECGITVGHVEAGLRSFDLRQPWPEEANRIAIDELADLLFAPCEAAALNLAAEPRVTGKVFITGNSGIDALLQARRADGAKPRRQKRLPILVTCHRHENKGAAADDIAAACRRLVRELPVKLHWPLHSNSTWRKRIENLLGCEPHIELGDPVDYAAMVKLIAQSWLVISDSGGLQEEASALGRPHLILREVTERPEVVACGSAMLVGTDASRIFDAVAGLLNDPDTYARMSVPAFPYGKGDAAGRIVTAIETWFAQNLTVPA